MNENLDWLNHTCKECGHYYNESYNMGLCFRQEDKCVRCDNKACSWFQREWFAEGKKNENTVLRKREFD